MATATAPVMEASSSLSTTHTPPTDDTHLWTPAQESALLQAIVRWKPVGMHKHFRMIAIRDHLLSSGAIDPEDSHTSIAGIWRKLASLYDLEKLDEREDSIIFDGSGVGSASVETDGGSGGGGGRGGDESRSVSSAKGGEYWREFELPRDEFEEMLWERRLAPEASAESSPLTQPPSPDVVSAATRRESTVADTDEPRSSPVSVSGRASGRGRGRASARTGGGGRLSRLQNELETEKSERGGSRRTSKAPSVVEQEEDRIMEDADEDGEEEQEESGAGEEEESEEHEEEETEQKRSGPSKRGRGGGRRGRGRKRRR
ncbi:uncharacterized protein PV07_10661 [Cladophialophora immunda]|uniref:Chromatin modification-related protein EAF7 n=1 Tax=Cladophialophora immunda TaxID=569365 RepID=A0A0D2C3I3_9EURO|nr:uncharacterized protein PV07_10661 [Cladophialophora immunda]KIW24985.1 hypothetical protein PV07_10661 [Cladophialophora immunda]OQV06664.1 hypothetical protein CLAIMM_11205 [Cladophialophora immunda]